MAQELQTTADGSPVDDKPHPRAIIPTKLTVPMYDPTRDGIVDVPKELADHLLAVGYTFPDGTKPYVGEEAAQQEKSDRGLEGGAHLAGHNFVNSLLFGLPQAAHVGVNSVGYKYLPKVFESPEELQAEDEHRKHLEGLHPIAGTASNIAGYIADPYSAVGKLTGTAIAKYGVHSILDAAGKSLTERAVGSTENLLAKKALQYGGRAGTALAKTGTEMAIRGGIEDATQQKIYDHKIDAERVFMQAANDFGWGVKNEAEFGAFFGTLKLMRTGMSKTANRLEEVLPFKNKRVGTEVSDELEVKRVKDKTVLLGKDFVEGHLKGKSSFSEKGSTTARTKADTLESTEESTRAKTGTKDSVSNQTQTNEKSKTQSKVSEKEQYPAGQGVLNDNVSLPEDGHQARPTRFVWEPGSELHNNVATWRQSFLDLAEGDKDKKALLDKHLGLELEGKRLEQDHVFEDPETGKQHFISANPSHAQLKYIEKHALADHLNLMFPSTETSAGFKEHLDEYYNLMHEKARMLSQKQLEEMSADLKPGQRTTSNAIDNQTQTRTKNADSAQNTTSTEDATKTRTSNKTSDFAEDKTSTQSNTSSDASLKAKQERRHYGTIQEVVRAPSKKAIFEKQYKPLIRDGIRTPIMYAAGGLGYLTGGMLGGTLAAGQALAIDTAIPAMLNNRAAVSRHFDKIMKPPIKALAATFKAYLQQSKVNSDPTDNHVNVDDFHTAYDNVMKMNSDANIAKTKVLSNFEGVDHQQPTLVQNLVHQNIYAPQLLQPYMPKDVRAPALRQSPFNPPRSQKIKFLKMYNAVTKPLEVMKNPSPAQVQIIEKLYPAHTALFRSAVQGALINDPKQVTQKRATALSLLMGSNMTARQDPDYMQRMHMSAHISENPTQGANKPSPSGSISGPKSAKVTNDAVNIDATTSQLNQLS